jgi:glutamate/tyrosine decarboxylase-like PLP-dependent enzyme
MSDPDREETLDPATPEEWAAFRTLGHQMVDDMLDRLRTVREQPVWRDMPADVRAALGQTMRQPVPRDGIGASAAYREFVDNVLPYPNGNIHPRFSGWVMGAGTPLGMMADMLAAGLNPNLGGFNQAPALVEHQVISWFAELFDMPQASGLIVNGGTMASTVGLMVARFAKARELGLDSRADGMQTWPGEAVRAPLVCYGSTETHGWARKAVELLGLGARSFRRVPVNASYEVDVAAMERMIAEDRAAGLMPFCILGTAGTVNTGATDDLVALAALAKRERLWFHVDGAFGALAYLSPALRSRVAGVELADSLGFDLHKWASLPIECACVLVRDAEVHRATFAAPASYLAPTTRAVIAGGLPFAERGVELTRGFKALKVWMSLRADGVDKMVRIIEQNVAQTQYLAERIESHPDLELLAPAPLNIACFRYAPRGLDADALNALNEELLIRLQESGVAVPSGTVLGGRYAIRVANVNHRTRREDLDILIEAVLRIGGELRA